jgi:dsRNA-specific ribonuclease
LKQEQAMNDYNEHATYQLGVRYQEKYREEKEASAKNNYKNQAISCFQQAYQNGHTPALKALCDFYQETGEIVAGIQYFEQWINDKKNTEPLLFLAELHDKENNVKQVFGSYFQAAIAGNKEAMYQLACLYEAGKGIAKNIDRAIKWLHVAFVVDPDHPHPEAKKKLEDTDTEIGKYYLLYQAFKNEERAEVAPDAPHIGLSNAIESSINKMKPYFALENTLGYYFKDAKLLLAALNREIDAQTKEAPFQMLEFLGNSVLGTLISQYLLDHKPIAWKTKDLQNARQRMTDDQSILPEIAKKLGLQHLLRLDKPEAAYAITDNMLANAAKALIGAISKEGGLEAASKVVISLWKPYFDNILYPELGQKPNAAPDERKEENVANIPVSAAPTPRVPKPHTPRSQNVFSSVGGNVSVKIFENYLQKAPHAADKNNIGNRGDTPLMLVLRSRMKGGKGTSLRPNQDMPKIKLLLKYGAMWKTPNYKDETAEQLLKKFPESTQQEVRGLNL